MVGTWLKDSDATSPKFRWPPGSLPTVNERSPFLSAFSSRACSASSTPEDSAHPDESCTTQDTVLHEVALEKLVVKAEEVRAAGLLRWLQESGLLPNSFAHGSPDTLSEDALHPNQLVVEGTEADILASDGEELCEQQQDPFEQRREMLKVWLLSSGLLSGDDPLCLFA